MYLDLLEEHTLKGMRVGSSHTIDILKCESEEPTQKHEMMNVCSMSSRTQHTHLEPRQTLTIAFNLGFRLFGTRANCLKMGNLGVHLGDEPKSIAHKVGRVAMAWIRGLFAKKHECGVHRLVNRNWKPGWVKAVITSVKGCRKRFSRVVRRANQHLRRFNRSWRAKKALLLNFIRHVNAFWAHPAKVPVQRRRMRQQNPYQPPEPTWWKEEEERIAAIRDRRRAREDLKDYYDSCMRYLHREEWWMLRLNIKHTPRFQEDMRTYRWELQWDTEEREQEWWWKHRNDLMDYAPPFMQKFWNDELESQSENSGVEDNEEEANNEEAVEEDDVGGDDARNLRVVSDNELDGEGLEDSDYREDNSSSEEEEDGSGYENEEYEFEYDYDSDGSE